MVPPASFSSDPRIVPTIVGERERETVVRRLGDHYAQDHLTLEEYEFRLQAALQALHWYQLEALTSDLPNVDLHRAPPVVGSGADSGGWGKTMVAIMGAVVRKGRWLVPRRLRLVAIMGGIDLDLRDADLSSPVTEIYVVAIMGGAYIKVPPGVRLETDGIAIMGGFEDQAGLPAMGHGQAPVVRIRGLAIMGGVGTKVLPRGWPDDEDDD